MRDDKTNVDQHFMLGSCALLVGALLAASGCTARVTSPAWQSRGDGCGGGYHIETAYYWLCSVPPAELECAPDQSPVPAGLLTDSVRWKCASACVGGQEVKAFRLSEVDSSHVPVCGTPCEQGYVWTELGRCESVAKLQAAEERRRQRRDGGSGAGGLAGYLQCEQRCRENKGDYCSDSETQAMCGPKP